MLEIRAKDDLVTIPPLDRSQEEVYAVGHVAGPGHLVRFRPNPASEPGPAAFDRAEQSLLVGTPLHGANEVPVADFADRAASRLRTATFRYGRRGAPG